MTTNKYPRGATLAWGHIGHTLNRINALGERIAARLGAENAGLRYRFTTCNDVCMTVHFERASDGTACAMDVHPEHPHTARVHAWNTTGTPTEHIDTGHHTTLAEAADTWSRITGKPWPWYMGAK